MEPHRICTNCGVSIESAYKIAYIHPCRTAFMFCADHMQQAADYCETPFPDVCECGLCEQMYDLEQYRIHVYTKDSETEWRLTIYDDIQSETDTYHRDSSESSDYEMTDYTESYYTDSTL